MDSWRMRTGRLSILILLTTIMALAMCALCGALGLVCGSAYGEGQSGGGDESAPLALMAGSNDGSTLQTATSSKSTTYNIGSGSCVCIDPSTEYTIVGTSTNGATVTIKGGNSEANAVHVTLDNVTIDQGSVKPSSSPITVVSGYAVIKLRGTNVLKAGYKRNGGILDKLVHDDGLAGLCVPKGSTCIITSADGDGSTNGSLEAYGGHDKYGGAGIGTNYDDDTGSIYINGGTVKAYGAHSAAGIGSGRDGECYTVCIQGGDVWAWGGEYAAGIGGGDAVGASTGGTTHDLWIHGGTVHAYGGNNGGAGIGGSEGGSTDKITITGGSITAYGCGEHGSKGSAAGIGSGDGEECGTIKINQGSGELTINATGCGEGAGIGGANCKSGTIDIKLRGGTITATGGPEAAGIGSGDDESRTINIAGNGTVSAYAGWKSAAIGAGDQGHSGPININGNSSRLNINAYAPKPQNSGENFVSYAAIIGAGDGSASDISINNANINLNGSPTATIEGAGIGTGSSNDLSMKDGGIANITISNAKIRFYSLHEMDGAGIGAGYGSNVKTITLDGVDYEGPTIGSSCSDRFGTDENSVDSISISNSNIKAIARGDRERNHAGIGTGPYGTIDSISISNSNVEAKGVYGAAGIGSGGIYVNPGQVLHLASSDGKCGSVTISGRGTVKATGSEGGAGIGAGTLTSVFGDISISKGATVEAIGGSDSGAGIGGGKLCSCANITVDGATVIATGGPAAAGIGSGGISDSTVLSGAIQTTWNTVCGNITITGASNVTATGGDGAAGIGLGQGAQMESGSWITISGGTVNATGGARGAGIGAGCEGGLGRGGEARRIKIEGEAKVTATGGVGAAGIGGGYEGGVEQCHIGLSVNDPSRAFVIARGGVGAAGIGAGASSRQSTSKGTIDGAHDAKNLSFSGGFVAAYGGDGSESSEEGRTGAGAGVGGGSYQGDLEGCTISGGVLVAYGGEKASGGPSGGISGQDIGRGGSREGGGDDGSDSIYIQGGTVVGSVNENESVLVSGGSVTHQFAFDKATKSNFAFEPVYQNAIAIDTSPLVAFEFAGQKFYSLGLTSTSADYFHCVDVFAVADGKDRAKAYLYLPTGEANATTAFVKPVDVTLSYYGTTTAEQYPNYSTDTNVLKMGAPITIVPKRRSADLIEGEPYIVRVGDLSGALGDGDTACYITDDNATQHATYEGYRMADDTMNSDVSHVPIYTNYATSGRTYTDVTVIPGIAGETMRLTAKLNGASEASDLYWGNGETVFEAEIGEPPLYVEITNDLTKYYDGKPVIDPEYDTNGTVYDTKYSGYVFADNGNTTFYGPTQEKPSAIGNYSVTVWAKDEGDIKHVTDTASFNILNSPKVQIKIVEDPTKYYDGSPVANPKVEATDGASVTYAYSSGNAPTEPGVYLVTATATVSEGAAQVQASDTRLFLIHKCPVELAIDVSDKVYDGQPAKIVVTAKTEDGKPVDQAQAIELSYYEEQDDGTLGGKLDSAPVDIGSYRVVATSSGSTHYRAAEASAKFSILDELTPYLYVDMPERFVYDAEAIDYPLVWYYSDGEAEITYYDENGAKLDDEPKDAGSYSVEVTVPKTEKNCAVSSGKIPFTILPRPAVLSISAVGDQSAESAKVIVTISGALSDVVGKHIGISVAYDDQAIAATTRSASSTRLAVRGATDIQAEIAKEGESLAATHEFSHVGAGEYKVTASYSNDPNYIVKDKTEHFDKRMRGYRISAEDKTVTFGDASFAVQTEVRDTNGSEVKNPTLSYSQVSSEDLPMVSDDAAVLGDNGTVNVRNAGMSAIRVDVAGDDTHEGDFDYAVITVEKAPLPLSVCAKDKTADGKPAEVAYSVDDAAYPMPYSGNVTLTYYREVAGTRTQLDAAPNEIGSYVVVSTAASDRNYDAAIAEASFKIQASSDPDSPVVPDSPDSPVNPSSPDNPDNPTNPDSPSNPAKPNAKPTTSNNSGGNAGGIGVSSAPRTGDSVVVWPLAIIAALGFVVLAYSVRRIRVNDLRDDDQGQSG